MDVSLSASAPRLFADEAIEEYCFFSAAADLAVLVSVFLVEVSSADDEVSSLPTFL